MFFKLFISLFCTSTALLVPSTVKAEKKTSSPLVIEINKGIARKVNLAFPGFSGDSALSTIIQNDLKHSGAIALLQAESAQPLPLLFQQPDCSPWHLYDGAYLLTGLVSRDGERIHVIFRVFDVRTGTLRKEGSIQGSIHDIRALGHAISNAVYKVLTGEDGYFHTKIFYTAEVKTRGNKASRIAVMDCDGENMQYLSPQEDNVISFIPKVCKNNKRLVFSKMNFNTRQNLLAVMDLETRQVQHIPVKGIPISPTFSPDGNRLLFCIARGGCTSIYEYDFSSGKVKHLTRTAGRIHVSPSFDPSGRQLVFVSDEEGTPALYLLELATGRRQRLSRGQGSYFTPSWSPDGKWITFVKKKSGQHYIGVMDIAGGNERMIATNYVVESPSWCPNSLAIVFASQVAPKSSFHLYTVDLAGFSIRSLAKKAKGYGENHPFWQQ